MINKKLFGIVFVLILNFIPSLTLANVKISIKMQGGFNYLVVGDVNSGTQGFFDWTKADNNPPDGALIAGGYKALHRGYEFGGDLIFELNRNIGIGIGASYLWSARDSQISIDTIGGTSDASKTNTKLSAIPIRLGMFLTLPLGKKVNFTANAGVAYYFKAKYNADWYRWISVMDTIIGEMNLSTSAEKKNFPIGFHGSIGIEYKLLSKVAIFAEAQGRYARFHGLEGSSVLSGNIGTPSTQNGKLYYASVPMLPLAPKLIMVQTTPPAPGPNGETYEASVDFSGVSLQAGIRIHF